MNLMQCYIHVKLLEVTAWNADPLLMSDVWGQQWVTQCLRRLNCVCTRCLTPDSTASQPAWFGQEGSPGRPLWSPGVFSAPVSFISFIYFWKCAKRLTAPLAWSLVLTCCGFQCGSRRPPLKVNLFSQRDNLNLFVDAQQGHYFFC